MSRAVQRDVLVQCEEILPRFLDKEKNGHLSSVEELFSSWL